MNLQNEDILTLYEELKKVFIKKCNEEGVLNVGEIDIILSNFFRIKNVRYLIIKGRINLDNID